MHLSLPVAVAVSTAAAFTLIGAIITVPGIRIAGVGRAQIGAESLRADLLQRRTPDHLVTPEGEVLAEEALPASPRDAGSRSATCVRRSPPRSVRQSWRPRSSHVSSRWRHSAARGRCSRCRKR